MMVGGVLKRAGAAPLKLGLIAVKNRCGCPNCGIVVLKFS